MSGLGFGSRAADASFAMAKQGYGVPDHGRAFVVQVRARPGPRSVEKALAGASGGPCREAHATTRLVMYA